MGEIKEAMKKFVTLCANCNHSKVRHEKPTFRDEGRSNLKSIRTSDSNCNDCDCKEFKSK